MKKKKFWISLFHWLRRRFRWEAPKAANVEDSKEDDSSICTFTTARLDAPRVCVGIVFLHRIGSWTAARYVDLAGNDGGGKFFAQEQHKRSGNDSVEPCVVADHGVPTDDEDLRSNGQWWESRWIAVNVDLGLGLGLALSLGLN